MCTNASEKTALIQIINVQKKINFQEKKIQLLLLYRI